MAFEAGNSTSSAILNPQQSVAWRNKRTKIYDDCYQRKIKVSSSVISYEIDNERLRRENVELVNSNTDLSVTIHKSQALLDIKCSENVKMLNEIAVLEREKAQLLTDKRNLGMEVVRLTNANARLTAKHDKDSREHSVQHENLSRAHEDLLQKYRSLQCDHFSLQGIVDDDDED